ncbi:MAG: hypothetical protein V4534_05930 [Myxococcota bacterium]
MLLLALFLVAATPQDLDKMIDSIEKQPAVSDARRDCSKKKVDALQDLKKKLRQAAADLRDAQAKADLAKQTRYAAKIEFIFQKAGQLLQDSAACFGDGPADPLMETAAEAALRDNTSTAPSAVAPPMTPAIAAIGLNPATPSE